MSQIQRQRNRKIREEFLCLQAQGMKVDEICALLSPKYFLTPIRIRDIVYRTQQNERVIYEQPQGH